MRRVAGLIFVAAIRSLVSWLFWAIVAVALLAFWYAQQHYLSNSA